MAKSVDQIVKGLSKVVTQLQANIKACSEEVATQLNYKLKAESNMNKAHKEGERAVRIRDKIKELLK